MMSGLKSMNYYAITVYSWRFKHCKVAQRQMRGVVVDHTTASSTVHLRIKRQKN